MNGDGEEKQKKKERKIGEMQYHESHRIGRGFMSSILRLDASENFKDPLPRMMGLV